VSKNEQIYPTLSTEAIAYQVETTKLAPHAPAVGRALKAAAERKTS
jgi:hypothetical protein